MDWGLLALAITATWGWGALALLLVMLGAPPAPPRRIRATHMVIAACWPLLPLVLGTAWLMVRIKASSYDLPP